MYLLLASVCIGQVYRCAIWVLTSPAQLRVWSSLWLRVCYERVMSRPTLPVDPLMC